METKTQKSAFNDTIKAEEKKVMADQPASSSKAKKPKTTETKQTAKSADKSVKKVQPKKAVTPKKTEKRKIKVIRDSFSIPENEYRSIATLKKQCVANGMPVKKSELLRAGIKALLAMTPENLKKQLLEFSEIKTDKAVKGEEKQ